MVEIGWSAALNSREQTAHDPHVPLTVSLGSGGAGAAAGGAVGPGGGGGVGAVAGPRIPAITGGRWSVKNELVLRLSKGALTEIELLDEDDDLRENRRVIFLW